MSTHYELNNITNYQEAIAVLQSIDTSDSTALADLSTQMITVSFNNPYAKAINTAIFQRWAEVSVEDATEHTILRIDSESSHINWLHDGLKILASFRPEYLLSKVDCTTDSNISSSIYQGISANNPKQFASYVLSCVKSEGGDSFIKDALPMAIFGWADSDPKAAYDWVQTEAAEELQQTDLSPLMWKWFEKDPTTAIVQVERLLVNRDNLDASELYRYSEMFATHLASSDPAAAYRWVMKQDDPYVKDNMLSMVSHYWSETDPEGLKDFVSQMTEDEKSTMAPEDMESLFGASWQDDLKSP